MDFKFLIVFGLWLDLDWVFKIQDWIWIAKLDSPLISDVRFGVFFGNPQKRPDAKAFNPSRSLKNWLSVALWRFFFRIGWTWVHVDQNVWFNKIFYILKGDNCPPHRRDTEVFGAVLQDVVCCLHLATLIQSDGMPPEFRVERRNFAVLPMLKFFSTDSEIALPEIEFCSTLSRFFNHHQYHISWMGRCLIVALMSGNVSLGTGIPGQAVISLKLFTLYHLHDVLQHTLDWLLIVQLLWPRCHFSLVCTCLGNNTRPDGIN